MPAPHKFKSKQLNSRPVTFQRSHFNRLTAACAKAMTGMGSYHPSGGKPADLRGHFEDLYAFLASHAKDEFGDFEFDTRLMSAAVITHCDLVQGIIHVGFTYNHLGQTFKFELRCTNDAAPYGQCWPEMLEKVGGNAGNYAAVLSMV